MAVSILKDGKPVVLSVDDMIQLLDTDSELTRAQAVRKIRRLGGRRESHPLAYPAIASELA